METAFNVNKLFIRTESMVSGLGLRLSHNVDTIIYIQYLSSIIWVQARTADKDLQQRVELLEAAIGDSKQGALH